MLRRADAGQEQNLRRADRAGGQDDFAATTRSPAPAILPPADADGATVREGDAFGEAAGFEPQIGPMEHRLEESARRRPAPAALLVHMEGAASFVVAGVEVDDGFDAGLFRRPPERVEHVPVNARRLDLQFAADAMDVALAQEMVFVPFEKRQNIVPAPTGKPKLAPMIVVGGLSAHVDHGVDRR